MWALFGLVVGIVFSLPAWYWIIGGVLLFLQLVADSTGGNYE